MSADGSMSFAYGSVSSGIEAASVAWAQLGWRAAFFSEIAPFPSAVLRHHYPNTPNLGDMTKYKEWPDAAIDLLVGGTPCQSFSVAGLRKGLADPRGNLMLTYGAIAGRYRPKWLVWENVPGVLSSNSGRDFGTFLGMLGELGYGYAYRILDAQYFGVPQRRRRVFVVGCLGDWRAAAAVLFERHSLSGHPAPRRETRQEVTVGTLAGTSPGGGWRVGADEAAAGHLIPRAFGGGTQAGPIEVATAQTAHGVRLDFDSETFITHSLRGEGFDASEDGTGRGTPLVPSHCPEIHPTMVARSSRGGGQTNSPGHNADETLIAFDSTQITRPTNRSNPQPGDPCHTLAKSAHAPAIAFDCKASGQNGFGIGDIASTQRAMGHANSHTNGGGHQAALVGSAVRRITPRECERLQGFEDDYTLIPYGSNHAKDMREWVSYLRHRLHGLTEDEARRLAADGPRYKALGNSMAVPCMRWIGERLAAVDAIGEAREAA